jgi:hypothetical protein
MQLGERLVYMLKAFMVYLRILDPNGTQTFEGGISQKK